MLDGEARSILPGLNGDTSALMSEINEDVKALDGQFRGISKRWNCLKRALQLSDSSFNLPVLSKQSNLHQDMHNSPSLLAELFCETRRLNQPKRYLALEIYQVPVLIIAQEEAIHAANKRQQHQKP